MPEAVAPTPPAPVTTATGGLQHTRWFLVAFYALAVVWGIRNVQHSEPSRLDLLTSFALAVCLGWWAVVDARRRRHPIPVLAKPWFFLTAWLVVPGYVLWSRGWRGVGWVVLHGIAWHALATIALHASGIIMYGEAWLRALRM